MFEKGLSIRFDQPVLDAVARADPANVDKAMVRTLSRMSDRAKTAAFKGLGMEFNITQKVAKSKLTVPNPKARITKNMGVHIGLTEFVARRISLMYFKPKIVWVMSRPRLAGSSARRRAVQVKIRKRDGAKISRVDKEFSGFLGRGRAGKMDGMGANLIMARKNQPFFRSRKDRLPARKMDTKAPSMMLMSTSSNRLMDEVMRSSFVKEFINNLTFYQSRKGAR